MGALAGTHRARARGSSRGGGTGSGARGGTGAGRRRASPRRCLCGDGDRSPRDADCRCRQPVVRRRQPGASSPRAGTSRRRRCGGGTAVGFPHRRRAPSAGCRLGGAAPGRSRPLRGGFRQQRGSLPGAVVDRGRPAGDGATPPRRNGSRRAGLVRGRHAVGAFCASRRGDGWDRAGGASGGAAVGTVDGTRRCSHRPAAGFRRARERCRLPAIGGSHRWGAGGRGIGAGIATSLDGHHLGRHCIGAIGRGAAAAGALRCGPAAGAAHQLAGRTPRGAVDGNRRRGSSHRLSSSHRLGLGGRTWCAGDRPDGGAVAAVGRRRNSRRGGTRLAADGARAASLAGVG